MNAQEHEQVIVQLALTYIEAAMRDLQRACAELATADEFFLARHRIDKLRTQLAVEWSQIEYRRAALASAPTKGAQQA